MAEEIRFPTSHLELAKILKDNNNCVSTTLIYLEENFQMDYDERKQLERRSSEYEVKSGMQRNL